MLQGLPSGNRSSDGWTARRSTAAGDAGHEDIELDPGADESLFLGRSVYQLIGSFKGTQRVGRKRG